jgi:fatty-acyl-CoA synthase
MSDFLIEHTPSAYKYPLLIKHLLHAPMTQAADQEIVYRDISRYTYRDLHERIGRLADALTAQGVVRGDVVGVLDWDSPRYLECYFAIPMLGATLQTVNIRLSPEQVLFTLNHARPKLLLVNVEFLPLVEQLRDKLESVESIILISDDGTFPATAGKVGGRYEELLAKASPDFAFQDFDENTRATMFYTTGTTGVPKGVYFSHRQLVLHTLIDLVGFGSPARQGRFHREDVYMPITPMFHVHGWGLPYAATAAGVKQVYPGRYQPDLLLDLIKTEGVTFSHCVPTILQMLLAAADRGGVDLTGWLMTIGGAALTHALYREARARGMEIVAGYGMSETAPTLAVCHRRVGVEDSEEADMAALTLSGVPVPLVSVKVMGEGMRELPHDGVSRGELVVRAPWLTPCYTGDPEASEKLWRGGWLHTQDVATIDAQGYIQIKDRLKDVIKTGGEWICSLTVEDLLAGVDGLAEVAVIGVPDAHWGERPIAVAVATPGGEPSLDRLNAPLQAAIDGGQISRYALLERVELIEAMPKTSVGKIDKKVLRARFAPAAA